METLIVILRRTTLTTGIYPEGPGVTHMTEDLRSIEQKHITGQYPEAVSPSALMHVDKLRCDMQSLDLCCR